MVENNGFLKPFKIKDLEIPTKVFFAPINTGYARDGYPTDRLLTFQCLRSGRLIGVNYTGNVAIGKEYVTNVHNAYFNGKVDNWRLITKNIKENDSVPAIQLGCRYSNLIPLKENFSSHKDQYINYAKRELENITKKEIEQIINKFVDNAIMAFELGYEIIQIHAAHGYFLSLMLSDSFNQRKDEYGKNRTLILTKIIDGIRDKNPKVILDVRLSVIEGVKSEIDEFKYKEYIMKDIVNSGIDIISLSNGIYNIDKRMIYPDLQTCHGLYINQGRYFAIKYPKIIWNTAGNIHDLQKLNECNLENLSFSLGRALLADPDMISKFANNDINNIRRCTGCNKCHYYSNGDNELVSCMK